MKNPNVAERNFLSYKMDVKFDVFLSAMMHRVGGHVDRGHIVAVHQRRLVHQREELAEELPEPDALGDRVGNTAVVGLCTGA